MAPRSRLTPDAQDDLTEAVRWIWTDSPRAARRLRQAIAGLAQHLGDHPMAGTRRPELASDPYRFAVVRGFHYVVVYNASTRPPTIVRIVHGARDLPEVLKDLQ
ncbi:MAG: type II toxin-antitoxin system RelE/ParE family toxin [Caulobacteraceae bacterium]